MDILVVGSVALDSVKTPFGEVDEALGGSATHFTASASFFTQVNLVGVIGEDFPMNEIKFLKDRGVNLEGLQVKAGKTFRWKGKYEYDLNVAHTLETHLNVFGDFAPEIPQKFRKTDILFLANIHPKLQMQVLEQVERPKLIALDTMNFWISSEPEALKQVIRKVDLMVINEGEARALTGQSSFLKSARWIHELGPKTVVIKQGEYGSLLFHWGENGEEIFSAPGLPLEEVKDPTGAGDSFAGGFVGFLARQGRLDFETMKQAMIAGSAMASYNVEEFSCRRLKELTKNEIVTRMQSFKKISNFEWKHSDNF